MVFPLLSRPLKTTATIALHNRTEVHYSALSCVGYCRGYCVSLERPLDNRRGAEGEEKEREGSGTERSEREGWTNKIYLPALFSFPKLLPYFSHFPNHSLILPHPLYYATSPKSGKKAADI